MQDLRRPLLDLLEPAGQEHLLAFWEDLDESARKTLARQIRATDFQLIARAYRRQRQSGDWAQLARRAASPSAFRLGAADNRFSPRDARQRGEQALKEGRVAVILVAGGQGTRLGFPHPKGMFPIGPLSGRSLFQIHVDRLCAVAERYGTRIPLYVMTSPATHDETVAYFRDHQRWGLAEDQLRFFCQGTLPAVDKSNGKVLLADRHQLALSPDGHGGMLAALAQSGSLAEIRRRGIEHLFYFQVDNPLAAIADPEMLGYHLLADSEMTTEVVAKQDPKDKVGNVVLVDGRLRMIEYSDLPDEAAERREADGRLSIWAGSIAVHVFEVSFLDRMSSRDDVLPLHLARKKVPFLGADGQQRDPDQPNAIKFERFIFDLLPEASGAILVEVDAAEGFAPLKNASGAERDTPETVRAAMVAQHHRWLTAAGAEVRNGCLVEVHPEFALDAEELARKIPAGHRVDEDTYFR